MVVNRFKTMGARGGGGGRGGRGGGGMTGQQKYYAKMSRNEIANHLVAISGASNNSTWQLHYDEAMGALYAAAGKPNTFGGKIAKDILDRTEAASKKYGKTLSPRVSSKQAWAIANALSTK